MKRLVDAACSFGVVLTPTQVAAFETYFRELTDWNQRVNLTGITDPDQVLIKHFLDSLSVAQALDPSVHTLIDIGTGAGFPGIPLKIAFPDLAVTLVDTTRKKVDFLRHIVTTLNLDHVQAIQARAEDLGHDPAHRERYDRAVARAVAEMPILLEYALPFIRVGGIFVAQKSVDVEEELKGATAALTVLGGRVRETIQVNLPGLEPRQLVLVEKVASTPPAYPRRSGIPERKPLR